MERGLFPVLRISRGHTTANDRDGRFAVRGRVAPLHPKTTLYYVPDIDSAAVWTNSQAVLGTANTEAVRIM